MYRKSACAVALAIAVAAPLAATAADDSALTQIRDEIRRLKDDYEARIRALEQRVQAAETKADRLAAPAATAGTTAAATAGTMSSAMGTPVPAAVASTPAPMPAAASAPRGGQAANNAFNPAIALILGGSYARFSQDPEQYRIQGFVPGGKEVGPGVRNFNLGESELTLSANIDHRFSGQLTFALAADDTVGVEEAFVRANGLAGGVNAMAGRFLSGIGYLNGQHAHAWDFVDAPLAYQAFFGGQYKTDGLQMKWLAPTDRFLEFGVEVGRGDVFPGNDRNRNGLASAAAFVHLGDDIGDSASWRLGLSYLRNGARDRAFDDVDAVGTAVTNAFTGHSGTWIADAIYKWAPDGNSTQTNLKLQGEYFRRTDRGVLTYDTTAQSHGSRASDYRAVQSGWYAQATYQFMPQWRAGLRYDRLRSGSSSIGAVADGLLAAEDFSRLLAYNPSRASLMIDYSPSEYSRLRVQLARDQSRPGATDNQLFLQYIMSLGVHGAHAF